MFPVRKLLDQLSLAPGLGPRPSPSPNLPLARYATISPRDFSEEAGIIDGAETGSTGVAFNRHGSLLLSENSSSTFVATGDAVRYHIPESACEAYRPASRRTWRYACSPTRVAINSHLCGAGFAKARRYALAGCFGGYSSTD